MPIEKMPYFLYDESLALEYARGALRIFLPENGGYINLNLVRSNKPAINCDVWRTSTAFFCDGDGKDLFALTSKSAEWDMAILIKDRPDFIGGYAHGDERMTDARFYLDGEPIDITAFTEPKGFESIEVTVDSVGYDPKDGATEVLTHRKEYRITKDGIKLSQRVRWLGDYTVEKAFLAMMPPTKELTDRYFTDLEQEPREILCPLTLTGVKTLSLYSGKERFVYRISVSEHPPVEKVSIADNRTSAYNKVYFTACENEFVEGGTVWNSVTEYSVSLR